MSVDLAAMEAACEEAWQPLRIGELCAGYGGLGMAVRSVLGGEIAWVADNDPDKSKILACRFPGVPNHGDLETLDWAAVEPVDVLTAGFPCKDISCAGQQAGLRKGNRSGVWYYVARVIAALRPPLVVIENVKELLSVGADSDVERCPGCMGDLGHESAMRALGAVLGDLASLGFDAEWTSLPAASAGACHLRWRVFVLAWPAADAYGSRGREITGGAHGDESEDAGWSEKHDHRQGGDRADVLAGGGSAADAGKLPSDALGVVPNPEGVGRESRRPEHAGIIGGPDAALGGSRTPPDTAGVGRVRHHEAPPVNPDREPRTGPRPGDRIAPADTERSGRGGRAPEPQRGPEWGTAATWHRPGAFGRYEAAVRRHERLFGRPVPSPVEPARNGNPRLSARFSEWMMGLPDGWVTDVPGLSRNAQLTAIGDGVVPAQAAMALRLLLDRAGILPLVAADTASTGTGEAA